MTGPALDPRYATALRSALADRVSQTSATRPRRRWRPAALTGAGVLAVAIAGGGVAVATGLVPVAFRTGAPYDVALAPGVPSAQTGPAIISLQDVPKGTSGVELVVTCVDAGTVGFPDGSSVICDADDNDSSASQTMNLTAGGGPLDFTAPQDMRWMLELTWLLRTPTDWQTNARGETYGVTKRDGSQPDLLAAYATNGAQGYYRVSEYDAAVRQPANPKEAARRSELPERTVPLPVNASDGTTVLGQFEVATRQPQ